jgi:hypothetical protein
MEEPIVDPDDPADAFAALSDPVRVGVLRALWEADDQSASFSELYDAVDVDDSGRFNYHLDKLLGRFVRKTDDGYELALAGRHVVGSLLEGAYTTTDAIDPVQLAEPCPFCGGDRTFHYGGEAVRIECADCPVTTQFDAPPGVFAGHERAAFPDVAARYVRVMLYQSATGLCPYCEGQFRPVVETGHGEEVPDVVSVAMARSTCARCEQELVTDLGTALMFEPAVVGFYADHGVDLRDSPLAEVIATGENVNIRGRDPLRIAVTYATGDERLEVVVDESLSVQETERN